VVKSKLEKKKVMGSGNSARTPPRTPFPQYSPPGGAPPQYNISRPPSPVNPGYAGGSPLTRKQEQKLVEAQRTIQSLQQQMASMQRSPSPMPYNSPPIIGPGSGYPPPSPILQHYSRQSLHNPQPPGGLGGHQGMDYAAVANIAGLNPIDIALLHREYVNLTRGGINKIDRVIFRQLLRESLVEANNENIDRTIENIFVSIDRNCDGFIDFPEFVGAFRDVLKGNSPDPLNFFSQNNFPNEQYGANPANSGIIQQALSYMQQPQAGGQGYSMPSMGTQQSPMIYSGPSPLVIPLDQNPSQYMFM
jgi:hypothetical protein